MRGGASSSGGGKLGLEGLHWKVPRSKEVWQRTRRQKQVAVEGEERWCGVLGGEESRVGYG